MSEDDAQNVRLDGLENSVQYMTEEMKFCKYVLLAGFASLIGMDLTGIV